MHAAATGTPLTLAPAVPHTPDLQTQLGNWVENYAVCDSVRCGETAKFQIRDGGSCSSTPSGKWKMKVGVGRGNPCMPRYPTA